MTKKFFYSHIIETETLIVELDNLNLASHEKLHLAKLVDSNLHHTILDVILSQLNEEDKLKFLKYLAEDDRQKIWDHLNQKTNGIEDKILQAAEDLKKDLKEDIKEAQRIKKGK